MLKNRARALAPGLRISTKGNNQDFWGILWGRPTGYLLLLLIGDWKWVTPNLITHVSNFLLLAASALVLEGGDSAWLLAAIVINLSLSFDCADGQLARYRAPSGRELGSFYDKVSDAFGLVIWFSCLGWVATQATGELKYFVFAMVGAGGQIAGGYAKWVCMSVLHKRGHVEPVVDSEVPLSQYPWRIILKVFRFAEPDLLFWTGLGLVLGRVDLALYLVLLTQVPVVIASVAYRAMQVHASDKRALSEVS